jgi:hypothetical protein
MGRFLPFVLLFLIEAALSLSVKSIPETGTPPSFREFPGFTLNSSENKLYIYGGYSDSFTDDMWEFDLTTNRWSELYPTSSITPGARSEPFILPLLNSSKILLFGGQTKTGPVSDLWLYDIQNQSVLYIQWKVIDEKGSVPPRGYYRSTCTYIHEGKQYLAVYGGVGKTSFINALYM